MALEHSGAVAAARLSAERNAARRALALKPLELRLEHKAADGLLSPRADNHGVAYGALDDTDASLGWGPPSLVDLVDGLADERAAEADRDDVEDVRRALAAEVRGLFVRLRSLRAERELSGRALEVAERIEASAHARVQAEAAPVLDQRLAGLERLDAAAELSDVEEQIARAAARLQSLTGVDGTVELATASAHCRGAATFEQALARTRERSPRLRSIERRLEAARAEASTAWVAWIPWFDRVQVGYVNEPTDKRDALRARVDLALPLFAPLSPRAREAELELSRLEALRSDEERAVSADVRAVVERVAGAQRLVKLYEDGAAGLIEASVSGVESELAAGQTDLLRVAEVQGRALSAQRGLLRARLRCEEAAIDLLRLTDDVLVGAPQ